MSVPPSPREGDEAYKQRQERRDKIRLRLEIGVGLVVLVYTVVSIGLWRATNHANEIASDNANRIDKNFTIDERPWVSADSSSPDSKSIKEGTPIVSRVTLLNSGKTFCKQLIFEFAVAITKNTNQVAFNYDTPHVRSITALLPPNTSAKITVIRSSNPVPFQPETFTKTEVDDLLNGRAYIATYGRGWYWDIFGQQHWLHYCAWQSYYPKGIYSAEGCIAYNDTGDGPPLQ